MKTRKPKPNIICRVLYITCTVRAKVFANMLPTNLGWFVLQQELVQTCRVLSFINVINQWLYLYTVITAAIIAKCNQPGERTQMHFASEHTITQTKQHRCVCMLCTLAATHCYVPRTLSLSADWFCCEICFYLVCACCLQVKWRHQYLIESRWACPPNTVHLH